MARLVIGATTADVAAEAAERALGLLGVHHRVTVLFISNPALIASPLNDAGATTPRLSIDDDTSPEEVLASAARVEADARSELDDALRRRHLENHVRVRVDTGVLGETLIRVAREEQADLIVIGRRRPGRARRLRHVIEHAPCPVLVVNAAE